MVQLVPKVSEHLASLVYGGASRSVSFKEIKPLSHKTVQQSV